jgi:hypothetical protein
MCYIYTNKAIRFSLKGLKLNGSIINIPLYLIFNLENYIKEIKKNL